MRTLVGAVPADPFATTGPTVILGATLVLHAATLTGAGGVLAVSRIVGVAIVGAGVPVLLWYRNRLRTAAPLAQSRAK
jgi:hypothetical protein